MVIRYEKEHLLQPCESFAFLTFCFARVFLLCCLAVGSRPLSSASLDSTDGELTTWQKQFGRAWKTAADDNDVSVWVTALHSLCVCIPVLVETTWREIIA